MDEKKKRLEDRKRQRKDDRRTAYYRQKEEEAQRIHEESLKKGERPAPLPPPAGRSGSHTSRANGPRLEDPEAARF